MSAFARGAVLVMASAVIHRQGYSALPVEPGKKCGLCLVSVCPEGSFLQSVFIGTILMFIYQSTVLGYSQCF